MKKEDKNEMLKDLGIDVGFCYDYAPSWLEDLVERLLDAGWKKQEADKPNDDENI